jgi:hypothetical protein
MTPELACQGKNCQHFALSPTLPAKWHDAWVYVGACNKLVVSNQPTKVRRVLDSTILLVSLLLTRLFAEIFLWPKEPTSSPTKDPTTTSMFLEVDVKMLITVPPCPPHYNMSAIYKAGDRIETEVNIWKCRHTPYKKYCSIAEMKESWSDEKKHCGKMLGCMSAPVRS